MLQHHYGHSSVTSKMALRTQQGGDEPCDLPAQTVVPSSENQRYYKNTTAPDERRKVVSFLIEDKKLSERRASRLVKVSRTVLRYEKREDGDGELREENSAHVVSVPHGRLSDDLPSASSC